MNSLQSIFLLSFLTLFYLQNCTKDEKDEKNEKGNIVFWRYTDIINCGPVEVDVFVDDKFAGIITNDYLPHDSIPICNANNCLTIDQKIGIHEFRAECYCGINKTKIRYWIGKIEVKKDSCSRIFLDIQKAIK